MMDATQFRGLVEQHQRMVFSLALRIARERGIAEEVAQDVFLELYRTTQTLAGPDHIRYWLRRVTVHRATDALRRRSRQPEVGAEMWLEEQHVGTADGNRPRLNTSLRNRLETMVGSLPEAMRIAVVLRYGEDMTPDEISSTLGQPLATVKSNLQRALKLLREKAAVTMKEFQREQRA